MWTIQCNTTVRICAWTNSRPRVKVIETSIRKAGPFFRNGEPGYDSRGWEDCLELGEGSAGQTGELEVWQAAHNKADGKRDKPSSFSEGQVLAHSKVHSLYRRQPRFCAACGSASGQSRAPLTCYSSPIPSPAFSLSCLELKLELRQSTLIAPLYIPMCLTNPFSVLFHSKYLANAMKSKGLQRLRWYCQVCEKQCRDDNGFKCHIATESHLRQMLVVGESAGKHISDFSMQFQAEFVSLLSRR